VSHTHHCSHTHNNGQRCNEVVAVCGDEHCQGDEGHYCTRHHPDPNHRREDPPVIRMTVAVAKEND
jgi:hypothetical protein